MPTTGVDRTALLAGYKGSQLRSSKAQRDDAFKTFGSDSEQVVMAIPDTVAALTALLAGKAYRTQREDLRGKTDKNCDVDHNASSFIESGTTLLSEVNTLLDACLEIAAHHDIDQHAFINAFKRALKPLKLDTLLADLKMDLAVFFARIRSNESAKKNPRANFRNHGRLKRQLETRKAFEKAESSFNQLLMGIVQSEVRKYEPPKVKLK